MTLEEKFQQLVVTPSDINELLPIIRQFIPPGMHITEFGTRRCVSAFAFLSTNPAKFVTYDIVRYPEVDELIAIALDVIGPSVPAYSTPMEFHQADVLQIDIEPTDVLFIDTYHTAEQCTKELERHAGKVRHWLIFHDTHTFWETGEEPYEGITADPGVRRFGLKYAIEPFLQQHPEWVEVFRTDQNNGLLILQRNGNPE